MLETELSTTKDLEVPLLGKNPVYRIVCYMFGENPNESCEEKSKQISPQSYPVANKSLRLLSSKEGEHIQYTYEQPKLKKKWSQ